jgi:hypothetical protein
VNEHRFIVDYVMTGASDNNGAALPRPTSKSFPIFALLGNTVLFL